MKIKNRIYISQSTLLLYWKVYSKPFLEIFSTFLVTFPSSLAVVVVNHWLIVGCLVMLVLFLRQPYWLSRDIWNYIQSTYTLSSRNISLYFILIFTARITVSPRSAKYRMFMSCNNVSLILTFLTILYVCYLVCLRNTFPLPCNFCTLGRN